VRRIERALISVFDKTGVVDFARGLAKWNVDIISTGGTHKLLASNGIPVREVTDVTGFPEILDGRVKTINPRIAGGVLAMRDNSRHSGQVVEHNIPLIDLVCINLYPFVETTKKPDATFEDVIENIDIGGPSLIRAAAKNFQDVVVVTSPEDYRNVLELLKAGNGVLEHDALFELAQKAFLTTARYDAQIAQYLSSLKKGSESKPQLFPANIFFDFEKSTDLRYGENPHQKAAFYRWGSQPPNGIAAATQLQGKELSYNNLVDLEAAWTLVKEFELPACAIIKHTNPCGAAVSQTLLDAYLKAYGADTTSAFGSVIGLNRAVDRETATEIAKLFVEAVAAPGFSPEAMTILSPRKNLRLLVMPADASRNRVGRLRSKTDFGRVAYADSRRGDQRTGSEGRDQESAQSKGTARFGFCLESCQTRPVERYCSGRKRENDWRRGRSNEQGGFGKD
jgi:phosphoribosylaminoimidazolecarboxamide formyltransferase/IMP cyclohydrolase